MARKRFFGDTLAGASSLYGTVRWALIVLLLCVWLCSPCRAEVRQLTTDGRFKDSPTFIDLAGTEFAYVVLESPNLMRTMRQKLNDGTTAPLTPDLQKNEFEPAFSADGAWVASVQSRGNLSMGLVIRAYPTGEEHEVKPEGGFCGYRAPTFTPDGSRVFYSFADQDRQSIVSVNRQGTDPKKIITGPGHANWPSFARDGQRLFFSSTRDGNYEIYSSKPDGSDIVRLTDHPRQDIRPRVSPDGKRIVFTSSRDGNYELYLMRADGSQVRRLTDNPERDDYPAWHPNSRQVIFISERNGKHDAFLMDVEP